MKPYRVIIGSISKKFLLQQRKTIFGFTYYKTIFANKSIEVVHQHAIQLANHKSIKNDIRI